MEGSWEEQYISGEQLFLWLKRKVLINAFYLTLNGTETWTLTTRWSKECKQRTTKHGKMYARQKRNNLNKKPEFVT